MSGFHITGAAGTGGPDEVDPDSNVESLLAQFRGQSKAGDDSPDLGPQSSSHFSSYHHQGQSFYGEPGEGSAGMHGNHFPSSADYAAFPPAAPTPPVHGHGSHMHGPPGLTGMGVHPRGPGDDQRSHLLNLLKFNGQESQPSSHHPLQHVQQQSPPNTIEHSPHHALQVVPHQGPREHLSEFQVENPAQAVIHAPAPAAADPKGLLAALMKGNMQAEQAKQDAPAATSSNWNNATSPSEGTQQYLLNLLNRPKPSQTDAPSEHQQSKNTPSSSQAGGSFDNTTASAKAARSSHDFEPKHRDSPPAKFESSPRSQQGSTSSKPGIFGYTNPFEDLAATSPLNRTPKSSTAQETSSAGLEQAYGPPTVPSFESANYSPERQRSTTSEHNHPETGHKTEHIRSPLSNAASQHNPSHHSASPASTRGVEKSISKDTVAEAVSNIAQKVDTEVQEALTRAEQEQAQAEIAKNLDSLLNAKSDKEFEESAHATAQAIKEQLGRDENKDALNDALPPDVAGAVKGIVNEAAEGINEPVADSWESAETDQIVVIEENSTPVEVVSFPLKPWVSICVGDNKEEALARFRDEAALDIARLKKDFDQIDRNLVAASENYMAYGMSKHGGLRVIRQYDGVDAKLFTDTHDRIFNIAMSATPSDQNVTQKEAVLGTGVSGAVYWVQIKNGGKDHLNDAHPEQYGFVLPPVSNQEGDTPGGVLKTRARTSASNPEYFAVGRGKSINVVWPSFILEKNLFKPGHDRVVDTEKLFKQCSLKINTGKAGKDFTFSHDDTTIVSLDKSGRVKFWDARDLTAAAADGSSRNPMPAHTAVEVKDPILTFTTTPEGGKAWPTSVLLLDKIRPYQKGTALRYMVVGMKQNHSLQIWDIALGKMVQEINLPHSNESDAVCSVMYNPSTGMIVIGHPTRNSIYFCHFSAPRYTFKNLSQVEFARRIADNDDTFPPPSATAVISGIREFSFATKGTLRSLDILNNPTTASATDGDDPTLFELYSMHSKGVTCLFIKRTELGWSKDNKVIRSVDVANVDYIKLVDLPASPSSAANSHAAAATPQAAPPTRIATRATVKDALQKIPSSQGDEKRGLEIATPIKPSGDRKDEETPLQQHEKPEKKARKKKPAAAAAIAAAERESLVTSNGVGNNPQAPPKASTSKTAGRAMEPSGLVSTNASADLFEDLVKGMEFRLGSNMSKRLDTALGDLVRQMNDQQTIREANFMSIQESLLHMVSDVLNRNTETVLKDIIKQQFDEAVVPALGPMLRENIDRKLDDMLRPKFEAINKSFRETVNGMSQKMTQERQNAQRQTLDALPDAISHALKDPEVAKTVSDRLSENMASRVGDHVSKALSSVIPTLSSMTAQAVQNVGGEVNRLHEQIAHLDRQRQADQAKIDQLVAQTSHLSTMISSMSAAQSQMQKEVISLKQQTRDREPLAHGSPAHASAHSRGSFGSQNLAGNQARDLVPYAQPGPSSHEHLQLQGPSQQHSQVQHQLSQHIGSQPSQHPFSNANHELEQAAQNLEDLMRSGKYDEAMMFWLQSGNNEEELFKRVIIKYNPAFIADLQPLLLLSVGATISTELDGPSVGQKVAITEVVIYSFHQMVNDLDNQVREVTPKIMTLLKTRIEHLYLRISRIAPNDPILKTLTNMANVAGRINDTVRAGSSHDTGY